MSVKFYAIVGPAKLGRGREGMAQNPLPQLPPLGEQQKGETHGRIFRKVEDQN